MGPRALGLGGVLAGTLGTHAADARDAVEIPPAPPAVVDEVVRNVWTSCQASQEALQTLQATAIPGYDPSVRVASFDWRRWGSSVDRALADPLPTDSASAGSRLTPLLDQLGAVVAACGALRAGTVASTDDLETLRALATGPSLGHLGESARLLAATPLSGESLRAALLVAPAPVPDAPPPSAQAGEIPAAAQPVITLLDAAQQALVRKAMDELLSGTCKPGTPTALYLPRTCEAVTAVLSQGTFQSAADALHRAVTEDVLRLPEVLLERRGALDDGAVATLATLASLRAVHAGAPPVATLRALSRVSCPGATGGACPPGALAAVTAIGDGAAALEAAARSLGPLAELDEARLRTAAAALALKGTTSVDAPAALQRMRDMESQLEALRRVETAPPADRVQAVIGYIASRLGPEASGIASALAPLGDLYSPSAGVDPTKVVAAATTFAAQQRTALPGEVAALVQAMEALRGARSAPELLSALAASPWVSEQLARRLRGGGRSGGQDPFMDAPRRRPGKEGEKREGLARYVGGVRAGYVFQHWVPQEIPDVEYSTVGLNLARFELLLESDAVPVLKLFEGYFRYELAPGGKAEQDQLVQLYASEASGWQALVADVAANLPGLGGDTARRGPVFGFRRRFFMASAEALKDYWYYNGGGVELLVPGDRVRTTTIMTTLNAGFRSTTVRDDVPKWGWEAGGFYMSYRKPYTHSRFTTVDRAAIFDSTFAGFGAYGAGTVYVPSSREDAPGSVTLTAKLGRATILLDDIAAADILPGDAPVMMAEVDVAAQLPVVWFGGFFLGGMANATYRTFGDFFSSGEPDPSRANDQTLNDDWIFGLSAQAGYLL